MGLESYGHFVYALPRVAEKGFLDVILTVEMNGGHRLTVPDHLIEHTAIGIMAEIIVTLELNPLRLMKENPFRGSLECQVRYTPHQVEPWLKNALLKGDDEVKMGNRLAEARGKEVPTILDSNESSRRYHPSRRKEQPMPESVRTVVNYRIAPHDSLASVKRYCRCHLTCS